MWRWNIPKVFGDHRPPSEAGTVFNILVEMSHHCEDIREWWLSEDLCSVTANQATIEGFSLVIGHQNPPTQGLLGSDSVGQVLRGGGWGHRSTYT